MNPGEGFGWVAPLVDPSEELARGMKEKEAVKDPEATAEEAALVDQFAAFAKSYFIYPSNNERVQSSLIRFLDTFSGYSKELKALEISVRRDHLRSSSGRLDGRKPVLVWLRECMEVTRLYGIRLDSLMTEEGLMDFMAHLQENRALREREKHKEVTFKELWPAVYPGISLWERSFQGGYHNRASNAAVGDKEIATVRGALDGPDPEGVVLENGIKVSRAVLEKVNRVERILQSKGMENAPEMSMNLLAEVMNHLPAEALSDPAYAESKLEQIMDEVERLVAGLVMRSAPSEEQKVKRLLATVVRKFFPSSYTGEEPVTKSPAVSLGRPGDELIDDDLEAFIRDLEALPQEAVNLDDKDRFADAEALGACLYRLTYCPREASARTIYDKLSQLLANPDEECLKILTTYADLMLGADTDSATRTEAESVFEHLRASNLLKRVRENDCLKVDSLAFAFPIGFLLFVDALDERKDQERQELEDLCARVGDERIRREELNLTSNGGILKPSRAAKVLSCSRPVLPLVRIIARHGERSLRQRLVAYLTRLDIGRPEVAALRVVEPADKIPKGYLIDICNGELDFGTYKPTVRDYAGFLIRNYLRDLPDEDEYLDRRVYAILSLKDFPGQDTVDLLKDQIKGKGPLGLIRPAKAIRDAVSNVQSRMGVKG